MRLVTIADGANDNWDYLHSALPPKTTSWKRWAEQLGAYGARHQVGQAPKRVDRACAEQRVTVPEVVPEVQPGHQPGEAAAGDGEAFAAVREAIDLLDTGQARVAEVGADGEIVVHQWLKQAILLFFKLAKMETIELGPFEYADKIPLKSDFAEAVKTAVINKRAGGMGLISGRKAFQRPMDEGIGLLHAIQDVYLSPEVTVA